MTPNVMSAFTYPAELPIPPLTTPVDAAVTVPGSKSITNRALVLAALAVNEKPDLYGVLRSEDTEVMLDCLRALGFSVDVDWDQGKVRIDSDSDRVIPAAAADLFVANSGTTMRFLAAMVSLGHGRYRLDGIPRMRERPVEDLLASLRQLGVRADSETGNGCPPVVIESTGWQQSEVAVRGATSSQYLSGLMMAAAFAPHPVRIRVDGGLVSEPYVEMTYRMIDQWAGNITRPAPGVFATTPATFSGMEDYDIEPDASAASYFWALPAITGGRVLVRGLTRASLQGDVAFVDALARMGCAVEESADGIAVRGGALHGIDVDMNAISDTVMTLAAVACFADGPTTIRNVAHIRHKETDRIAAVATELRKLGAEVDEFADGLRITPRPLTGCAVDTYNDHRMAMSLALVGLRVPGVVVKNPGCVAKTYPGFWQDLDRLRG